MHCNFGNWCVLRTRSIGCLLRLRRIASHEFRVPRPGSICFVWRDATDVPLRLGVNAGAKLRQPAGVKLHHARAHCWGGILAAWLADLLGRASGQAPGLAQRRAAGAGLDGESAHRAIISDAAMRVLYYADELAFWASGGRRSSSGVSGRERLERRLLWASR